MTASKRLELRGVIVSLYGGFESADLISAKEDQVINGDEFTELAAMIREENYLKHMAGANERNRQRALARLDARKKAMEQPVAPGMILRGNKWISLQVA